MKVGIVTIFDLGNYGNRLQNYALSHVLQTHFRCRAETLVSHREQPFENRNYRLWLKNRIAKACCVAPSFAEKRWGANMTRWANFHRWSKRHIPTRFFYGQARLPDTLQGEYDRFFAGSDQIWNWQFPSTKFDDYFLRFAKDGQKIAYSASFGVDHLPEALQESYREGLKGFAHLSVREEAGACLAKTLLGREVPVLIDPVMLLTPEEWLRVAKKPRVDITKPYVLKYYLGNEEETEKIDHWAKANGYAVYELMNPNRPELYSAGPGEFLTLIANAALVASDSFHCIAFSILFHRPFLVYVRKDTEGDMTSRLDTLLQTFRLTHRWKHMLSPEDYLSCDFSETEHILKEKRARAMDYIRTALGRRSLSAPQLAEASRCTGCTACASVCPKGCITMQADENGFLYPRMDATACIHCGRCETHCPLRVPLPLTMKLPTAFAAYTKDEAIRLESSSGGIFTELAKTVLAQGGVVYGAAYDARFCVVHSAVEQEADLSRLRGAKYAQSDLGDSFLHVQTALRQGRSVLFSGTPCQVAGLKSFLGKEYENLTTVDFVCHSVPSPMAWQSYLRSLGDVRGISLRAKDTGWSRYRYCHRVVTDAGTRLIPGDQSLYMKLFVEGYLSRQACETCHFKGYRRCSDITLGDFWGIWEIAPDLDDDKGTSVVLCQTQKGAQMIATLAPRFVLRQVSPEETSRVNTAMLHPCAPHPHRAKALTFLRNGQIAQCEHLVAQQKPTFKQKLRNLLSPR